MPLLFFVRYLMETPKTTTFFLGANSQHGFYSLYSDFASGPADRLHIIKAGPGTGKSTFMRRIGQAAETRGYPVEYIVCSGDPDSLDGVYLPDLHVGWVDGTAPHVMDPVYFGASGDYVNLGQFCDLEKIQAYRSEIEDVTKRYQAQYRTAYALIAAAGMADSVQCPELVTDQVLETVEKRADTAIRQEFSSSRGKAPGHTVRRFLSAISCQGDLFLADSLNTLCERVYYVENQYGLADRYLHTVLDSGVQSGANAIVCPSPLRPEVLEAVLFPEQGVAFLSGTDRMEQEPYRTVHLDALPDRTLLREHRRKLRETGKAKSALLDIATQYLQQAKRFHDQLETYYKPALNIAALNEYTEQVISDLF